MEELLLLVEPGGELPQPGKIIQVTTVISKQEKQFKVKTIKALRWNHSKSLICEVKGDFVRGSGDGR